MLITTFSPPMFKPACVARLYITVFSAMNDGASDRLVSNDGPRVSGQVSDWLHALRQQALKRRKLTRRLNSEAFTRGTTDDDDSIALCTCTLRDTIKPFQKG